MVKLVLTRRLDQGGFRRDPAESISTAFEMGTMEHATTEDIKHLVQRLRADIENTAHRTTLTLAGIVTAVVGIATLLDKLL